MRNRPPDAGVFVILGATGDLAERKLLPALAHLRAQEALPAGCVVLGVGRRPNIDDASFRASTREAVRTAGANEATLAAWNDDAVHYQCLEKSDEGDMRLLAQRLAELEAAHGIPPNRTFYLSLPPSQFEPTIDALGKAGLAKPSGGWTRLVVEKPFGRDLESAMALNGALHAHFDEAQIYRIDHYLGKETVQNLLVFRLANPVFEALWNRNHVEAVQILVGEELGVEDRAGYYDRAGALRDMVQNHLTQLVTLVAMGEPALIDADSIRQEKVKVLHSLAALRPSDVVLGRYVAGKVDGADVPGYLDEPGVPAESVTETYASMALHLENWRWQGVPFYVRTGKRLARRMTQIAITFREPPVHMFHSLGTCHFNSNVLVITLQPDEGFELQFDVKKPGDPFELLTLPLSFRYGDRFGKIPDAYETLLLDVLEGDQTLFVHSDEVEASWKFWSPVLSTENDPARTLHPYAAGSWGPKEAERHFVRGAPEWLF
ncbi:glucose-6-phosphate dehydrogenase, partial [bacterium]|nr:glucose-6-phosphate dehydrogenase [bacterium]